jgi:hypothetical protein
MIKLDNLIAREEHLFPTNLPSFCGVPIQGIDEEQAEVDLVLEEVRLTVKNSTGKSIPAEVLPGEEICKDNIIRRSTTAEAVGYDTYYNQEYTERNTKRVSIGVARLESLAGKLVSWRPNGMTSSGGEYALVHEEVAA